ncbi:MAG: glycosyltransferase [Chloroflexi bacterium]|nr:glycosyltransferase [Chloroflexota bacterium]
MSHQQLDRPHIVFLFSDTGGGHRSAAQAIIEALELEFPGQTTQEMIDIFRQYAPPPLQYAPEIYPPLSRMPRVWGMGYHISDGSRRTQIFYRMIWPYIRWGLQRLVREHPCDLIVSVHQLINAPMIRAIRNAGYTIPFTTVVTDLVSTHAAWYSNNADLIIVPTTAAYRRALNLNIAPEKMTVVGLPVADRFCQPVGDSSAIRARLGWPQDKPVVLLVGGGEGMGPMEPTAKALDAARLPIHLVIVAGRNKKLKERLEKRRWQIPVSIYGFVEEMPDFMRAADILVTKAGPGTICEAFIAGLPLILYSRLPGQEDGNVDYVVDNGAGVWAPRPDAVVSAVRCWLEYPDQRQEAANAALQLARPRAAREIARLLAAQAGIRLEN